MQPIDKQTKEKTALVVEGGGMRGVFAAGVLDAFLDKRFRNFDGFYGVSAGALNLTSFIAGQRGRSLDIFTGACLEPNFISFSRHLRGGNLFDLDWFFEKVGNQHALNSKRFQRTLSSSLFTIVTTCTKTGYPVYHNISADTDAETLFLALKASSALPMIYRDTVEIEGRELMDGTLADPLPVIRAVEDGHNHIVLIRTRESSHRKKISSGNRMLAWQFRRQPALAQLIREQYNIYNQSLDALEELTAKNIRITEIAPESPLNCTRSTRNRARLVADYHTGYSQGYAMQEALTQATA